ncbi:hypothetical protein [Persicitalea sp.]|uniref:hypothetical protein n=1 Tax=Persicitalea sp. TaxID=3100273 RepID=UPI0035935C62
MDIYYSARTGFGAEYDEYGLGWERYAKWQAITRLEVITVDGLLNQSLVGIDSNNSDYWDNRVLHNEYLSEFFKSLDYVLSKVPTKARFNLLAVSVEPTEDCGKIPLKDFEFVGYDLLDREGGISSLTNCNGFIISYTQDDLNQYGLLKEFEKAYDTKVKLLENNLGHGHEDTDVVALWRHKTIGR